MKDSLVLGIDAAWTMKNPSGVALIQGRGKSWNLVAASSSYESFLAFSGTGRGRLGIGKTGSEVDPKAMLKKCKELSGGLSANVVAVDMPLSEKLITARRVADQLVSKEYGQKWCAVHSPSVVRPGKISVNLTKGFENQSFPLMVSESIPPVTPALIEVYPHVALVELMNLPKRLPYKVSKATKYWPKEQYPDGEPGFRYGRIIDSLETAWAALGKDIDLPALPIPKTGQVMNELKASEDLLDGVVCAWMGMKYLAREAKPWGDLQGAIWGPKPLG